MKKNESKCKVIVLGRPVSISKNTYNKVLAMVGNDPSAVSNFINDALQRHFDSIGFLVSEELSERVAKLEYILKEEGDECDERL